MAKSNGAGAVEEFDRHLAHAMVDSAIHKLAESTDVAITRQQKDWLYRMGMVGIMASFAARGESAPAYVRTALVKGKPLSTKRWQDIMEK